MSQFVNDKVEILVDTGAIFASAIETDEVKLDNYQSAKVVIKTGEGDVATTNATVVAVLPDETEVEIKSQEITIGAETTTEINIVANEIAHYDATGFKLKIDAVASSAIEGSIALVLGEPRYSE